MCHDVISSNCYVTSDLKQAREGVADIDVNTNKHQSRGKKKKKVVCHIIFLNLGKSTNIFEVFILDWMDAVIHCNVGRRSADVTGDKG